MQTEDGRQTDSRQTADRWQSDSGREAVRQRMGGRQTADGRQTDSNIISSITCNTSTISITRSPALPASPKSPGPDRQMTPSSYTMLYHSIKYVVEMSEYTYFIKTNTTCSSPLPLFMLIPCGIVAVVFITFNSRHEASVRSAHSLRIMRIVIISQATFRMASNRDDVAQRTL
jgi:hypothetical protein